MRKEGLVYILFGCILRIKRELCEEVGCNREKGREGIVKVFMILGDSY